MGVLCVHARREATSESFLEMGSGTVGKHPTGEFHRAAAEPGRSSGRKPQTARFPPLIGISVGRCTCTCYLKEIGAVKKRKLLIPLLALPLALLADAAVASWQYTKWGMSPAQVRA